MEKYIYKITNKLNSKSYIGQTTNYKRRWSEHKSKNSQSLISEAINKYGIENFTFELLEDKIPNYNEKEIFWIHYYDSVSNGYNINPGGNEPPLNIKENSPFATHTQKEVDIVIDLLLNSELQMKQIGEIANYNHTAIERINKGIMWHDEKLKYPLRKESSKDFIEERTQKIIKDLQNSSLTQKEIAKKHKCARSTVTAINLGQNSKQPNLIYPLRKKAIQKNTMSFNTILKIIKDLQESTLTQREIGMKYNCSEGMISNIKMGKSYRQENIIYPIERNNL